MIQYKRSKTKGDWIALQSKLQKKTLLHGWQFGEYTERQGEYNKGVCIMYDNYSYITDEAINSVSEFVSDTEYFEALEDGNIE